MSKADFSGWSYGSHSISEMLFPHVHSGCGLNVNVAGTSK